MRLLVLCLAAALLPGWGSADTGCRQLTLGASLSSTIRGGQPVCFSIEIKAGQPRQVVVSQAEDLALRLTGPETNTVTDSFDLGNETLTILAAGAYKVAVSPVVQRPVLSSFRITTREVSESNGALWREAETTATLAKQTKTREDIARSLELWISLGDPISIARTHLKEGNRASRSGDAAAARQADETALAMCNSLADTRCSAEAANNSGVAARQLGDLEGATSRLEEAARDWQRLAMPDLEVRTQSNLGLFYWQSGRFARAIEVLMRALKTQDPVARARVVNNLGLCHQSLADYPTAAREFRTALGLFERTGNHADAMRAKLNLGRTLMLSQDFEGARDTLEQALSAATEFGDLRARADVLRNLGQDLLKLRDTAGAEDDLKLALAADRMNKDPRGESASLHYLGQIAADRGRTDEGRNLLREAVQIRSNTGMRDDAVDSLEALARLEFRESRLAEARNYAEQALELLQGLRNQSVTPELRAAYYARRRHFFDLLVEMAGLPADDQEAVRTFLAADRFEGRSLIDMLADGTLLRQLPPELQHQRSSIQQRIDYLLSLLSSPVPNQPRNLMEQLNQLVKEDETLEITARESANEQHLGAVLTSLDELRDRGLATNSALLEFRLAEPDSYLWLVTHDNIREFRLAGANTIVNQTRAVVGRFADVSNRSAAARQSALAVLSRTLLGPLAGTMLPDRLILVPDGELNRVPFAALTLPGGRYLGIEHDLVQVPAASFLIAGPAPRRIAEFPRTILAVVDPVFDPTDERLGKMAKPPLPGPKELHPERVPFRFDQDVVESMVPEGRRQILRGVDASLATLARYPTEQFAVIQFYTHAVIDDRLPELSRIELSSVDPQGHQIPGNLRPFQLAKLHMNRSIVVLSACDTALGKQVLGEGLAGFGSSLFAAGAAQLVLTLTEVDAQAASRFMAEVYKNFLTGRMSMEHALRLARQHFRQSDMKDPYYWASFIVVGRPALAR